MGVIILGDEVIILDELSSLNETFLPFAGVMKLYGFPFAGEVSCSISTGFSKSLDE